jgi:bacillithiol biosynthesis cysteine-adding enzyme BshC
MENTFQIPYASTGSFGAIFLDYLNEEQKLKPFYTYSPNISSFEKIIADRKKQSINRAVLVQVLKEQYQHIDASELSLQNIAALANENTFTITTGHQLSLFTGELYFIYKIITCINLAEKAAAANPGNKVVPIFWMASEDHDFEEINHASIAGTKFEWKAESGGAVGELATSGIDQIIDSIDHYLGNQAGKEKIIQLFKLAYTEQKSLAAATRILVNELFKQYGLVIIDANHPLLKKEFADIIRSDIFEQNSFQKVTETNALLEKQYPIQVNPREINFFYLSENTRSRIIKTETGFETADQKYQFNKEELLEEIKIHSEKFSPNVIMRPLYQEYILPNLATVGGPGEIAYWLQLKSTFAHYQIPFPMLAWRNSFALSNQKQLKTIEALLPSVESIFKPLQELVDAYVTTHSQNILSLDIEQQMIKEQIQAIQTKLQNIDQTLLASSAAAITKIANLLKGLEKKMQKAEKKNHTVAIQQIEKIKNAFFPNGILQERQDNFSFWYMNHESFIQLIKNNSDPLNKHFTVLAID